MTPRHPVGLDYDSTNEFEERKEYGELTPHHLNHCWFGCGGGGGGLK